MTTRHAGVMAPLFSLSSRRGWGIGEFPDLAPFSRWLASANFDRLMLLPVGPLAGGDTSPYGAASAMAIDPIYIALDEVPEFTRRGGAAALSSGARAAVDRARASARIDYAAVRAAKHEALSRAFEVFAGEEWEQLTLRAADFAGYLSRERWWLDDFALYQAIAAALGLPNWRDWPPPLRDRSPSALDEARRTLSKELLRHQYLQWVAETQWQQARRDVRAHGVTLYGDLPFMVSVAGPDVWVRPDEFMLDVRLGVPPDAFSATGQDWGLPTYLWGRIREHGYGWMRQRARRMAALYDGYRVDHLVGLYRTFGRPPEGDPFFNPADQPEQVAQGEALLTIFRESGVPIIAEDLGVVPDFVRASMARLGVPGCKVMRWERDWHAPGQPFVDPERYPAVSAAMSGTHDTETLAGWWTNAPHDERRAIAQLGSLDPGEPWSPRVHERLLERLYRAGSSELFLPLPDVFGSLDRINVPATVGDHNWTWRLPWPVEELDRHHEPLRRAELCRTLAVSAGRGVSGG
jgi:4-alpha-glucanotransferase